MQGPSAYYLDVPYNELTERHVLKIHGYVFSDEEDGSTDSGGLSDFDEHYALLKPPPLKVDPNRVVVIKPTKSNVFIRKDVNLQGNKHNVSKTKKFSSRENNFNVSVNNFYSLLEESDNEESAKDSEIENEHVVEVGVTNEKVSNRKKKRRNKQVNSERLSTSRPAHREFEVKPTHLVDCEDDDKYTLDLNFFLDCLPWYFWSEEILKISMSLEEKIDTERTSWDNVSTNHVFRSDKLLEQEYYDIVGSKICACYNGYEYRRTKALKNLLKVTGMPCAALLVKEVWNVFDNDTFLSVVGILIAAFIYSRCK